MTDTQITLDSATVEQLEAESARRRAAIESKPAILRITVHFGSYNERRYSRPWIARVTAWPVGGRPVLGWGRYLGDDSGGECEIMARPGDIIRYGQKDTRGGNGANDWAIAQADGTARNAAETEARAAYKGGRA
jgi:hypothetical protein